MVPTSRGVTYRSAGYRGSDRATWRQIYRRAAIATSGGSLLAATILIAVRMRDVW